MVRNNPSYATTTTAAKIAKQHREDPDRNTDGLFGETDLDGRRLSPSKIGLWTSRTYGQKGALVGWFRSSDKLDSTRSPVLPRQSRGSVYHPAPELLVGDLPSRVICSRRVPGVDWCDPSHTEWYRPATWHDYFDGGRWTPQSPDRFPTTNWGELSNSYTIQPDYRQATTEDRSPSEVHEAQSGLDVFTGDVSPCIDGVRECSCCECPNGHKGIRHRESKSPTYVCNSPNCDWEGETPAVFPARREN